MSLRHAPGWANMMSHVDAGPAREPLITVIIVNFNTNQMLLDSIDTVLHETDRSLIHIMVFDNASEMDPTPIIRERYPEVVAIRSETNLGFASANNVCAGMSKSKYLLLLNPDTLVQGRAIEKLLTFAKRKPSAGVWGGRTIFPDGRLNSSSAWGRMTIWNQFCAAFGLSWLYPNSGIFNQEAYGGWDRITDREVDIVSGCFFLVKRDLWDSLGGFNEKYFMYGEEADFCIRAKSIGSQPVSTGSAQIVHFGGASEKVYAEKLIKVLRAKAQLIKDHWSNKSSSIGTTLLKIKVIVRVFIFRVLKSAQPNSVERYDSWRVWCLVWTRRKEWVNGFGE